jgi:cyclic-di-AMP phosphodiesterase PgpH
MSDQSKLSSWRQLLHNAMIWVFALVMILGTTLILSINLVGASQVSVTEGQPAATNIFAPRSLTYTSDVLTARAREQARSSVADVYTPLDLSIGRAQLARARAVFSFIDVVRADARASIDDKLRYLQAITNLVVEEQVALDLLELNQADYEVAKTETLRIIDNIMRQEISVTQLLDARRAARRQASLELTPKQNNVVTNLAYQFVVETVFADGEATAARRQEAAAAVTPVIRSVAQDQRIIRTGEIVTEVDVELLMQLGLLRQEPDWRDVGSMFMVALLSVTLVTLYWQQFMLRLHNNGRYLVVLGAFLLLFTLAARIMVDATGFLPYLYPLAALSLIVSVVYDTRFAILITLVMAALVGFMAPNSLELSMYTATGGLLAVLTLRDAQRVTAFFRAGVLAALGHIAIITIFRLPHDIEVMTYLQQLLYGLGNGLLSAALTMAGFYILGGLFGIITILQLQDLSRLDHPLLQELLRKAPGTYHHSIMVANLAEQAAERVRANSALVRVGAFYHDIGKMNRPPFFTENQEGVNPHDSLDAYTSARIIVSHVSDGLDLARRYHLPERIKDFIAQHHGTRLVAGFYHKAREQAGPEANEVDKDQFRYPGPRPRSREAGIVMLADAVEATSGAVRPNTAGAIEKLVNTIIDDDLMQGQLDDSGLTLGNIKRIRESFIETLKGRYHVRVRYPGNETLAAENAPEASPVRDASSQETAVTPAARQPVSTPLAPQDLPG